MPAQASTDARLDGPPRCGKLLESRRRSAQKCRAQINASQNYNRNHSGEIDNADQRAEDDSVRPTRAMPEQHPIGQPEKTKETPARVLARLYIQIGAEHKAAEQHRARRQNRQRRTSCQSPRGYKSRRCENDRDGIVCFS